MGAIATGGVRVLNEDVVSDLPISEATDRGRRRDGGAGAGAARAALPGQSGSAGARADGDPGRRRAGDRLDDARGGAGAATACSRPASSWRCRWRRRRSARRLRDVVDEIVCAETPEPFYAVGLWYEDFAPTADARGAGAVAAGRGAQPRGSARRPPSTPAERQPSAQVYGAAVVDDAAFGGRGRCSVVGTITTRCSSLVGDARFVLLGEASHGTHEFYRERARITRRLIEEQGFTAVAVEADWPDAYRVNRYVRGAGRRSRRRWRRWAASSASRAGCGATPTCSTSSAGCASTTTACRPDAPRVGFYGLDLYSLTPRSRRCSATSTRSIPRRPAGPRPLRLLRSLRRRPQVYGYATSLGVAESCEDEVVGQLVELQRRAAESGQRATVASPRTSSSTPSRTRGW